MPHENDGGRTCVIRRVAAAMASDLPPPARGNRPSWQPLVDHYLSRFQGPGGISPSDVDMLESWAANATAFDATGSWRAQVIDGTLWIKPLRFHSHWAERASVLRMMLLAVQQADKTAIPNLDLVYGHADNDNTQQRDRKMGAICDKAARREAATKARRQQRRAAAPSVAFDRVACAAATIPLPLLTNSHNPRRGGLPVPEFTWTGWQRAPPWCKQVRALDVAAEAVPWAARDRRLFFSGALASSDSF